MRAPSPLSSDLPDPLIAIALGALVLDEPVTWDLLAGAAIILVGVAVSEGQLGKAVREDRFSPESLKGRRP
jgi:hypothetical protein